MKALLAAALSAPLAVQAIETTPAPVDLINNPLGLERPVIDAGQILESIRQERQLPKSAPDVLDVDPPPKPSLKTQPGVKVRVASFKITGNTVYKDEELLPLISAQVGNELSFDELNQVAAKLSAFYRSKGYFLAQAYLPAQDIKGGTVEITVLEGRVGEVKLNVGRNARLNESVAKGILSSIKPGDVINEESLERGLLLLNDMPGVAVKSTLQPSKKVGEADVVVEMTGDGRRVTGSMELDNWGNRFAAENRLGLKVNLNNPSGMGDQLSFNGLAPLAPGSGGLLMARVSYLIPVGSMGTKVGAAYSRVDYRLGADFASLGAEGDAQVKSAYALHPFIRTRNMNVFGLIAADIKTLDDRVKLINLIDEKEIKLVTLSLSGDFRDGALGGGLNTLTLGYAAGNNDLQSAGILALDQGPTGYKTNGSFRKVNYNYQRLQYIDDQVSLLLSLTGQMASKNLNSAEKFSLGGPTGGVRGYPVGEASSDVAHVVSAELRWSMPQQVEWADIMVSGFVDRGSSQQWKNPLVTDLTNRKGLLAYGVGLNVGKPNNYLFRTTLAWHGLSKPPVSDVDRTPRMWLQFMKWF